MLKKTCPHCKKPSYGSSDKGDWVCPYCEEDITDIDIEEDKKI